VQQYKGLPPYRETHAYVARVIKDYNRKKLAKRKSQPQAAARPRPPSKGVIAQGAPSSLAGTE